MLQEEEDTLAQFKRHIIAYGDTIQGIAQAYFGDMSSWMNLAKFNDLKYPYIVYSNEEKMKNPDHLVTIGDYLLIKVENTEQADLIEDIKKAPDYTQNELYALALGKDLDIMPFPRGIGSPGYDSEILEMKGGEKGDVATKIGIENLKQSLFIRLITPKGSYIGHPDFGSNVHRYIGKKNTEENADLIDLEVERTLRTDGRVKQVMFIKHDIFQNVYRGYFKVATITSEEAFDFIITAEAEGPIVLEDNFNENYA